MAPLYRVIREGEEGTELFESFLVDEPKEEGKKLGGEAAAAYTGYFKFLEWLRVAALTMNLQEMENA